MSKKLILLGSFMACTALVLFLAKPVQAAGVTVSGTVVAPDGSALNASLEGINVNLNPQGPGSGYYSPFIQGGVFSIANVVAGQYQVMINYGGGHDYTSAKPFIITVGNSNVDLGTINLTKPSITGTLYAPDGTTPIPNASISIRTKDYTFNMGSGTDGSGNFRIGGLDPNNYVIIAYPPNGSSYAESAGTEVNYTGTVITGLSLQLTNPCVIGTVVQPDGSALSEDNAIININFYNQDHSVQKSTNTNKQKNGQFKFGSVPAGTYTLEVRTQNSAFTNAVPKTVTITSCATANNVGNILLTSAQIQGVVYRPDGTTPLANAWVQIHTDDWSIQQGVNTNANGQYTLGGISAGTYKLKVNKPWNVTDVVEPDEKSVTITTGGSVQTINFTFLQATKFLTGRVTKSNGTGVPYANINVNKEGASGGSGAQTAADGSYSLALSGGTWDVNVNPSNCPGCPIADWYYSGQPQRVIFNNDSSTETKTLNITVISANSTVTGRVLKPDGSPMTNANVDVRTQDGIGNNNQVSPDGSFTVRVSAGTYYVNVYTSDSQYSFQAISVTVGDNETKNVGNITAKMKAARIVGKVTKEDGTPLPGIYINANLQSGSGGNGSNTQSGSDGVFTLAVTAGRWNVNIDTGRTTKYVYSGQSVSVDLATDTSVVTYNDNSNLVMVLTYADATITGYIKDTAGNVINGFCSWAYARPNATTTLFGQTPEYGGPVNCQTGQFSISVPSKVASTYTIGMHMPPNSQYSAIPVIVAVFADTTAQKDITLKTNDATVTGRVIDQNGKVLTSCVNTGAGQSSGGPSNSFGGVNFSDQSGNWRDGQINSDCTYQVNLLSGKYQMGWWISASGYMNKPSSPDPITIPAGNTTINIKVSKADATITGRVVDPNGNGLDAYVYGGNWSEIKSGPGGPKKEDMDKELNANIKTNPNGTFSLPVLSGHIYNINANLPPGTAFMPSDDQQVNLMTTKTASVTIKMKKALGTMTGTVKLSGVPVNMAYVNCWNEKGGGNGSPVEFGGKYSLNYAAGIWHCGANSFNGTQFYKSDEVKITITTQTKISQDFALKPSSFEVPPPVTESFDAGQAHTTTLANGTKIISPAGAYGTSGTTVTLSATPTVSMMEDQLNTVFGVGYDLSVKDSSNNAITNFNSAVQVIFSYKDADLAALGLTEAALKSKYFDDSSNAYKDTTYTIDTTNNTITVTTTHFTKFAIVSSQGALGGKSTAANIMAVPVSSGGPQVVILDNNGKVKSRFFAYDSKSKVAIDAITADVNGDGSKEVITAPGAGMSAEVKVFTQAGKLLLKFFPYDSKIKTGIYISAADVNGDGKAEIITSPRAGLAAPVRVFNASGKSVKAISQFYAYDKKFKSGIKTQTGDVDGDGSYEIIAYPRASSSPQIAVFKYNGKLVTRFYAFDSKMRGSYNVAVGDVNKDGKDEIVVAAEAGIAPQVAVFNKSGKQVGRFLAFDSKFRGGVNISVGDYNNDNTMEILATVESKSGPEVKIFNATGKLLKQFWAYDKKLKTGITTFVADVNNDGKNEIVVAPGANLKEAVKIFNSLSKLLSQFFPYGKDFKGGIAISPAYKQSSLIT